MTQELPIIAETLVSRGKGLLAADETPSTLTRRFERLGIISNPETRRAFRGMLFSAPNLSRHISGVILQDETIRQNDASGASFAAALASRGIVAGIKVDAGVHPLAGWPGESITEGLDGLRPRLEAYRSLGARFAKWRATFRISETLPSLACVAANAHALARYAALCQEQGLVPIVEPEVLMDGAHGLDRCERVTGNVLGGVFAALAEQGVALDAMLLKPSMVISGAACLKPAGVEEVATATIRCLRDHVPASVPGVVFLSGGQSEQLATEHLNAIVKAPGPKPWAISFSYGRALQDGAMSAWRGSDANAGEAQRALLHRAACNGAASLGAYSDAVEAASLEEFEPDLPATAVRL
jgi:fructose-bisphosphate aldolase class I